VNPDRLVHPAEAGAAGADVLARAAAGGKSRPPGTPHTVAADAIDDAIRAYQASDRVS
jgi:hypothetical protein